MASRTPTHTLGDLMDNKHCLLKKIGRKSVSVAVPLNRLAN